MKNMIELENVFMEPLLLKGLLKYFPLNRNLFWDVKNKWRFGEEAKKLKNQNENAFCNGTINGK